MSVNFEWNFDENESTVVSCQQRSKHNIMWKTFCIWHSQSCDAVPDSSPCQPQVGRKKYLFCFFLLFFRGEGTKFRLPSCFINNGTANPAVNGIWWDKRLVSENFPTMFGVGSATLCQLSLIQKWKRNWVSRVLTLQMCCITKQNVWYRKRFSQEQEKAKRSKLAESKTL